MNSVSYDIVELLEQGSVGYTFGTDLYIGKQPKSPLNCMTLYDTSSRSPSSTLQGSDYNYESIQVRVRNVYYQDAFTEMNKVKAALHLKVPGFLNGTYYAQIRLLNGPNILGYDEKGAIEITANYEVQRTNDTNLILLNMAALQFFNTYNDLPSEGESLTAYVVTTGAEKGIYIYTDGDYEVIVSESVTEAPEDGTTYGRKNTSWNALAAVAVSGSYGDLSDAPDLSAVAMSGDYSDLSNTPDLAAVAFSGSYTDLSNKPDLDAKQDNYTTESITIAVVDWSGLTAIKTVTGVTAISFNSICEVSTAFVRTKIIVICWVTLV